MPRPLLPILLLTSLGILLLSLELFYHLTLPANTRLDGDLQRELFFLAQYGQFSCILLTCLLILRLDPRPTPTGGSRWGLIVLAVLLASASAESLKHLTGRVRPQYPNAGHFLGPIAHDDAKRQSFPSAHTACAFALSGILASLYPRARHIFWTLATLCGLLRIFTHAHFPSDVAFGAALGLAASSLAPPLGQFIDRLRMLPSRQVMPS